MKTKKCYVVKNVCTILILTLLLTIFPQGESVQAATLPKQEEWFSTMDNEYVDKRGIDMDGYYGCQCVDLANHYAQYIFGVNWWNVLGAPDYAKDLYATASVNYFTKIQNNTSDPNLIPVRGDLMIWGGNYGGGFGHVGIVDSATPQGFVVYEQNVTSPYNGIGKLVRKRYHNVYGYGPVIGWLRPKPEKIIGYTPPKPPVPEPPAEPLVTPADHFLARILTSDSGKALVCSGNDGNVFIRNSDPNDKEQYWRFIKQSDGSYQIRGYYSKLIEVAGAVDRDGTNIQVHPDNGSAAQKWKLHGSVSNFYMRPNMSVRVLDCTENVHGSNVHLFPYHGKANQRFKLDIQRQETLQVKTDGLYESATFTVSTDNPIFNTNLFVFKDKVWTGERVIAETLNSKTVTRSLAPGTYEAYFDYGTGGAFWMSNTVRFTVNAYQPPIVAVFRTGDKTSYTIGDRVALAARAEKGIGPYKYQFYALRSNGERVNFRKHPVSSNIYSWTPQTPGSYTVGVDIYDSRGNRTSREKTVTVKRRDPLSLAVFRAGNKTSYTVGEKVALAARAEGGAGAYKYQFYVVRSNGSKVILRKYASSNTFSWKPVTPDTYDVCVSVKDAQNEVVIQIKRVTVRKPLRLAVFRAGNKTSYSAGETVALAARGEGGSGRLRYQFYVYRSNGAKVVLKNYSYSNVFSWKPLTPDRYRVCVAIRDAKGSVVTKATYITVR